MSVITENYENNKYNKTQDFDDFLKNPDFKKKYEDLKNRIDEINSKNETSKEKISISISNWIGEHPLTAFTVAFIGTTFISYKLYQHLITIAVYKANIMTLYYIENNIEIVRKTIQ